MQTTKTSTNTTTFAPIKIDVIEEQTIDLNLINTSKLTNSNLPAIRIMAFAVEITNGAGNQNTISPDMIDTDLKMMLA